MGGGEQHEQPWQEEQESHKSLQRQNWRHAQETWQHRKNYFFLKITLPPKPVGSTHIWGLAVTGPNTVSLLLMTTGSRKKTVSLHAVHKHCPELLNVPLIFSLQLIPPPYLRRKDKLLHEEKKKKSKYIPELISFTFLRALKLAFYVLRWPSTTANIFYFFLFFSLGAVLPFPA